MIYQPEINKKVSYIYCSTSDKTSVLSSALKVGSCYKRKFSNAVLLKMYSRAARSFKTFCEAPSAVWKFTMNKADASETISISIEGSSGTFSTSITATSNIEALNKLKSTIEAGTPFLVDLFNSGFYAYTYSDDYDYTNSFDITLSAGSGSASSMEDNLEEIISFWNTVLTSDDVDMFSKDTVRVNNSTKNCS